MYAAFCIYVGLSFHIPASIRNPYCFFPSVNWAINFVSISSHISSVSSESNHLAAGQRKTDLKNAFTWSSYTDCVLRSFVAGQLPSENLVLLFITRMDAVRSSLESKPINSSNAKFEYAIVLGHYLFVIFSYFNFVLVVIYFVNQVAFT